MKIMTKVKIALLVLLFLASLVFFGFQQNQEETRVMTVLSESALPTITLEAYGEEMNELCGYVKEMNTAYLRGTVYPIGDDREIPFEIDTAGASVKDLAFEIRSLDSERQIEDMDIEDATIKGNKISAVIPAPNLVEKDTEYMLIITLTANDQPLTYYSRIIYAPDSGIEECIDFAEKFHDACMDKNRVEAIKNYIEPSSRNENNTLQSVDITSSLKQFAWADYECTQTTDTYMEVSEVGNSACEITLYYDIVHENEKREETCEVKEYYRLRKGSDRIYLLDFERTMEQKFSMVGFELSETSIDLGIVSPSVNYKYNDLGTICAFESAGELYIYNEDDNTISKIFSFSGKDEWKNNRRYDIGILNVDGNGMVDFLVYGYMAAGDHEGMTGMSLYRYDETSHEIQERLFINSDRPAQVFSGDLGGLMYENPAGDFMFLIDGVLEKVNISTGETTELLTGLSEDRCSYSESGRYIAYLDADTRSTVHIMDLFDQTVRDINAPAGSGLYPRTFLGEDFVYGLAYDEDVSSVNGIPMYSLCIVASDDPVDNVLKRYEKPGYYVTGTEVDSFTMYLERAVKVGDEFIPATSDTIMNGEGENIDSVRVVVSEDEIKESVVSLLLRENQSSEANENEGVARQNIANHVATECNVITLDETSFMNHFYVYSGTKIVWSGTSAVDAISNAYSCMGQVIYADKGVVWKRGRATSKAPISVSVGASDAESSATAKCISAILNLEGENIEVGSLLDMGKTPAEVLRSALKDSIVLECTGLTTDEIMYYIACGKPVYTMLDGKPVLLTGYDIYNFTVYSPADGTTYKVGLEDAKDLAEKSHNVFIVYLR